MAGKRLCVLPDKRYRLPDSALAQCQEVLRIWFAARGSRMINTMLARVEQEWNRNNMPPPSQLAHGDVAELMRALVDVDPTLHPRHLRLAAAMMAEHAISTVFTHGAIEKMAIRYARTTVLAMSKYRDLAEFVDTFAKVWLKAIDFQILITETTQ